jgi:sugar lactone lactonase YvrE
MVIIDADVFLDCQAHVGECPVWWPERNALVSVDPPRRVVHVTDVATRHDREVLLPLEVSAVAPATDGRFVVAVEDGIGLLDLDTGAFVRVGMLVPDPPGRFNDGACDPAGRFLAGTFAWDLAPGRGARRWAR